MTPNVLRVAEAAESSEAVLAKVRSAEAGKPHMRRNRQASLGAVSFPSMEYNNLRQIASRNYVPQKTPGINR